MLFLTQTLSCAKMVVLTTKFRDAIQMTDFQLEDSFGYLINIAAQRLKHELHQSFQAKGLDVTPEQWVTLNRLWEQDGLSQVELAERTFKDKPSMTRILNLLEKKGLALRQRDAEDGRVIRVFLTQAGRNLKEKLIPSAKEVLVKSSQHLTKEEVTQLKQILNKILKNLA